MDVVGSVRDFLKIWNRGGDVQCRALLSSPHRNITEPGSLEILTTAYHTLLCATLSTWSPAHPSLTPTNFVDFISATLTTLPSSSTNSYTAQTNVALFGDHLVDMIWTVDNELEELLTDARAAVAAIAEQNAEIEKTEKPQKQLSKEEKEYQVKVRRAQSNAENDKQRIPIIIKKLLESRVISPDHCRERLETTLLASVGLIQEKQAHERKEVRERTHQFYKQNKFNLLREQSEGYSKLIVELTSSMGPPHSPHTGRPTESYAAIEERARPVWGKVISLIGHFDLDPNRVLDIILDVLCEQLAFHYSFFLALLSLSPWAGSYRRPIPESEMMDTRPDIEPGTFQGKALDAVLQMVEEHSMLGLAPSHAKEGDARVLAQVLGFKFSYYHVSEGIEATPRNLYLTAAILIRAGFITLEDLYPHLSRLDEDMSKDEDRYKADVESRIANARNSTLAMAAPLESSGPSSSQPRSNPAPPPEPPRRGSDIPNQKIGLTIGLLAVGALRPAIALLSKFPWFVDASTEIADLLIRVCKLSISSLYETLLITKERNPSFMHPKARFGVSGAIYPPPRKPLLTLWAPTPPSNSSNDFVFFFPDWSDRVPISKSLEDIESVIEPILRYVGLHISRDTIFFTKFLRLGRVHLQSTITTDPVTKKPVGEPDPTNPIRVFWFTILRKYLLPALTLIRGNAVCTVEVWSIMRSYETTERWRLYGEWKDSYQSHPELRIRSVQAEREAKGIMRRLALDTIDSLSGPIGKLAHSNPCILFATAVGQIMAYENLANVVIQALRYATTMGFDVLVFIILDAFANPNKSRVKDDGVNPTDWLQSLAAFTGMLFRRYSADLTPVLKYIAHQLHQEQTTEIIVLKELILKMAGIEPLPSLSEGQMIAMAGGPTLRVEAIASTTRGARLDPSDALFKGPLRLGKGLVESGLALPLLIQVAQQRQACVYKAQNAHLKSLSGLYDTIHGVLLQYLELLTSALEHSEDYENKVLPTLAELGQDYGICVPVCMQIYRPVLHANLLKSAKAASERERLASEEAEKRLRAALAAKKEQGTTTSRGSPAVGKGDPLDGTESKTAQGDLVDAPMEIDPLPAPVAPQDTSPWLPELEALFEDVKKIAPQTAMDVIGPGFYTTFWQLSLYDIAPPTGKYEDESAKLRALSKEEERKYQNERSPAATSTHRARRDRYNQFIQLLKSELMEQTASREFTVKRFNKEKNFWFTRLPAKTLAWSVIEHCFQPRCLLSPMDADFCAQFVKVLHGLGTPGFYTLQYYKLLLGDHIGPLLFSCSEYEARNYGRFLLGILRDLNAWHESEEVYKSDQRGRGTGKPVVLPGMTLPFSRDKVHENDSTILKWDVFQGTYRKLYRRLSQTFKNCIETGEFMHVYNSLVVLKEILPVFPLASVSPDAGPVLDAAVDRLVETESRGDLKILARSYSASLKKKSDDWKSPPASLGNGSARQPPAPSANKTRNNPTASKHDARRNAQPPPSAPVAIRNNLANITVPPPKEPAGSIKVAMDSVPRPNVIKRVVRPEVKAGDSPRPGGSTSPPPEAASQAPDRDRKGPPPDHRDDSMQGVQQNGSTIRDYNESSRQNRSGDHPSSRQENSPAMPPPAVPSQTVSAQELRETARQSINRTDRLDAVRNNSTSGAPSPRPRSPSPSSRPGTRNPSNESRTSGGKSRSEAGNNDSRAERESGRQESSTLGRRDSITHNRPEKSHRARDMDKDSDRGRPRHGDRDHDRDRDKDRDRDRRDHRSDHRHKEEKDREFHRREDRERERESRKDKDSGPNRNSQSGTSPQSEERGLPTRPEPSRPAEKDRGGGRRDHRNNFREMSRDGGQVISDGSGKRKRGNEEDSERESKRTDKRDSNGRDNRGHRPPEKDNEYTERRGRRDQPTPGRDGRGTMAADRGSDKRLPEGPNKGPNAPSGPRAERTTEASGSGGGAGRPGSDRNETTRDRDRRDPPSKRASPGPGANPSLLSRLDKEADLERKRPASSRDVDGNDPLQGHDSSHGPSSKRTRTGGSGGGRVHRGQGGSGNFARKALHDNLPR